MKNDNDADKHITGMAAELNGIIKVLLVTTLSCIANDKGRVKTTAFW